MVGGENGRGEDHRGSNAAGRRRRRVRICAAADRPDHVQIRGGDHVGGAGRVQRMGAGQGAALPGRQPAGLVAATAGSRLGHRPDSLSDPAVAARYAAVVSGRERRRRGPAAKRRLLARHPPGDPGRLPRRRRRHRRLRSLVRCHRDRRRSERLAGHGAVRFDVHRRQPVRSRRGARRRWQPDCRRGHRDPARGPQRAVRAASCAAARRAWLAPVRRGAPGDRRVHRDVDGPHVRSGRAGSASTPPGCRCSVCGTWARWSACSVPRRCRTQGCSAWMPRCPPPSWPCSDRGCAVGNPGSSPSSLPWSRCSPLPCCRRACRCWWPPRWPGRSRWPPGRIRRSGRRWSRRTSSADGRASVVIWLAVALGCAGCYAAKLAGLSVPASVLARPAVRRLAALLPIALLAALIGVQTFGAGQQLVVDARLAGLAVAGSGGVAPVAVPGRRRRSPPRPPRCSGCRAR